jgi:hypothetical protein
LEIKIIMRSRPIIVTLTSIPSRFPFLNQRLQGLINQSSPADSIELYLPRKYRRFPEILSVVPPKLPRGVELHWVDEDIGPATKILPAYKRWAGKNVDLLLCDDDRSHDKRWIERLSLAREGRLSDIICERGWNIDERFGLEKLDGSTSIGRAELAPKGGRTLLYRLQRSASLGMWHPPRRLYARPGYIDIFEGFLGALIPPNAFDPRVNNIPESVAMVDDVWLSGMAALAGTNIWVHDIARPVYSDGKVDKIDSLRNYISKGDGRLASDLRCALFFRNEFKIW